jgi:hypothetical protein
MKKNIGVKCRNQLVCIWFILSLMVETRKHSLNYAAVLSGLNKAQFSKFLSNNYNIAAYTLDSLSKKQAKALSKKLKKPGCLPWTISIMIDSTLHNRSTLKTENSQKFNHGNGYVIGHQWTNIILFINDIIIPMAPVPFYSRSYCRKMKIKYKTEHERVAEYLKNLNLNEYIGPHVSKDVIVLADSGYDVKQIQNTIIEKKWHFIFALKSSRGIKSEAQYAKTPKSSGWSKVSEFFKNQRKLAWNTIRIFTNGPKKKRLDYRIRHTIAFLKGVGKIQVVCSEFKKSSKGRRKFLGCSDLKVKPRQIMIGYKLRWKIEIFHKHVKMHMGFEDVAVKRFTAVEAHVHLVYCAYILLHSDPPGMPENAKTILDKQQHIRNVLENKKIAGTLNLLTQFGGVDKLKTELKAVLMAA